MWHKSFTVVTKEITKEQFWNVITDVNRWSEWDADLEWTKLEGEPRLNANFTLKPKGGPKTKLTITRFDRPDVFADVAHLPLAKMHTIKTLTETQEGLNIRMDVKISGLLTILWSKVIGQGQIDGGPQQIGRLIEKAKTV